MLFAEPVLEVPCLIAGCSPKERFLWLLQLLSDTPAALVELVAHQDCWRLVAPSIQIAVAFAVVLVAAAAADGGGWSHLLVAASDDL